MFDPKKSRRSFYQIAQDAADRAASNCRLDYIHGKIDNAEFRTRRVNQSRVAHDRIEGILAAQYPGYKPLPFRTHPWSV